MRGRRKIHRNGVVRGTIAAGEVVPELASCRGVLAASTFYGSREGRYPARCGAHGDSVSGNAAPPGVAAARRFFPRLRLLFFELLKVEIHPIEVELACKVFQLRQGQPRGKVLHDKLAILA